MFEHTLGIWYCGSHNILTLGELLFISTVLSNFTPGVTFPTSVLLQVELIFKQIPGLSSLPRLVQNCSLSSIPLPLDTIPPVNLTNYTTEWNASGNQLTLFLTLQLAWMPPAGTMTSYDIWVGIQALNPHQTNGGSTPGIVTAFKVWQPLPCTAKSYAYVHVCACIVCMCSCVYMYVHAYVYMMWCCMCSVL